MRRYRGMVSVDPDRSGAPGGRPAWYWWPVLALFALLDPFLSLLCLIPNAIFRHMRPSRLVTRQRRDRGLLIVLSGIEGTSLYTWFLCLGVLQSGWRGGIIDIPWGHGLWPIQLLVNVASPRHRQRWAERITRYIRRYQAHYPGRPVHLLGHSAGTGLALEIAALCAEPPAPDGATDASYARNSELKTHNSKLSCCVLLCPAVSPAFDLNAAARGCRQIISIQGPADWFWLGLGTSLAGGCDRHWGPSAGVLGFRHPHLPDHLLQRWWTPGDLANGYLGNHCTAVLPGFIRHKVMPLLLAPPAPPT